MCKRSGSQYPWWLPHHSEDTITPTPAPETNAPAPLRQADFQEALHEKLRSAIRLTLTLILEEEVTAFIGAPRYGRTEKRRDQRNGYYARDLVTTAGKCEDLAVPRTRGGFRTQVFERYQRRQAALDTAISEMFVFGTSTIRVGEVVEALTGEHPSPSTVSRVFHTLEAEFKPGRPVRWPRITSTCLPMAPISPSFMMGKARKCPSWR